MSALRLFFSVGSAVTLVSGVKWERFGCDLVWWKRVIRSYHYL